MLEDEHLVIAKVVGALMMEHDKGRTPFGREVYRCMEPFAEWLVQKI